MSQPEPFASSDLVLVRRNPLVLGLAGSPIFVGIPALILTAILVKPIALAFTFHCLGLGVLGLILAWRRNLWPVAQPTKVRANATGVTIGDRWIPRGEIQAGFIMPGTTPRVLLRRRGLGLPVEIQVGSVARGRALLHAVGLDASQTVATFRTMSQLLARRRYSVTAGVAFGVFYAGFVGAMTRLRHAPALTGVGAVVFTLALVTFITLMVAPTRLTVGADGIAVRWLWQRRFYGYDQIARVSRYEKGWGRSHVLGIKLTLRSGEEVLLPVTQRSWGDTEAALVEERVREAMELYRMGGAEADAALLQRGDRDVGAWVTVLRAIGAGANADMRTAPVPRERLFRIVEDPASPAIDRAAAAVALGADLDDDGRRRLAEAAEATAAPKLRVAIEKIAESSDEAEMEAALAEIEVEGQRARA